MNTNFRCNWKWLSAFAWSQQPLLCFCDN